MRSKWIEYKGKRIFYQDFSNLFYDSKAVEQELREVQAVVIKEPKDSALVLSNFDNTMISVDMLPILNAASQATKEHIHKTAVLGVSGGIKRALGDILSRLTGQPLMYFDNEEDAKEWLVNE
jgi:hypothetical protein